MEFGKNNGILEKIKRISKGPSYVVIWESHRILALAQPMAWVGGGIICLHGQWQILKTYLCNSACGPSCEETTHFSFTKWPLTTF